MLTEEEKEAAKSATYFSDNPTCWGTSLDDL